MDTHFKRARTIRYIAAGTWLAAAICGLLAGGGLFTARSVSAQEQPSAALTATNVLEEPEMPPGYPSLDAPWAGGKSKPAPPVPPPAAPAPATQTPPPTQPTPETAPPPSTTEAALPPAPKVRKNEVSASADFFLGQGNVTMPFGFSLAEGFGGAAASITKSVAKPDRTSDYYGGTISYSWLPLGLALDLAYAHGDSSGNADVLLGTPPPLNSAFSIKDDRYQAYVRYTFPSLRGKNFSAYLRAGFTYVNADLFDQTTIPALGLYSQSDKTEDLLGNLGFGVGYFFSGSHYRFGLQAEGEGFYGRRTQKSTEALAKATFNFPTASIDNDLYGGIGRATLRFEYKVGRSGAFKLFADGGFQAWFTIINYPAGLGSFDEVLYGPYVKVGARFSF